MVVCGWWGGGRKGEGKGEGGRGVEGRAVSGGGGLGVGRVLRLRLPVAQIAQTEGCFILLQTPGPLVTVLCYEIALLLGCLLLALKLFACFLRFGVL